jgi:hypothetical protein
MKFLFHPSQFTFTNRFGGPHFNQSLLKSRIVMMNKRQSKWKAIGKYGAFIAVIWACAAFTKPYREVVSAEIMTTMPQIKALVSPHGDEKEKSKPTPIEVFLPETSVYQKSLINTTQEVESMAGLKLTNKKYLSYDQENEIHILITPKTSLGDIVEIQQELKQFGKDLKVVQWITDSSARYLRKLVLEFTPLAGKRPQIISRGTDTTFMPMKSFHLSMPISNFGYKWSYGDCCIDFSQQSLSREEDDIAKFEALLIDSKPDAVARLKRNGEHFKPTSIFYPHSLLYEGSMAAYQAITIAKNEEKTTLHVKEPYRNAQFRLNGRKSSLAQIENLSSQQFLKAEKYDVTDAFGSIRDTYFVIYSK